MARGAEESSQFDYFDGREWAGDEVLEHEMDSVTLSYGTTETPLGNDANTPQVYDTFVEPPERLLYPRPVESIGEARKLYLAGDITLSDYEGYLESLLE